jgi:hypothetical protein
VDSLDDLPSEVFGVGFHPSMIACGSSVLICAVAVVCWSRISMLGSIETASLDLINTLPYEHKSGTLESQLRLLPDFNMFSMCLLILDRPFLPEREPSQHHARLCMAELDSSGNSWFLCR